MLAMVADLDVFGAQRTGVRFRAKNADLGPSPARLSTALQLVEHGEGRPLVTRVRLEHAEVLEIVIQREQDLGAHVRDLMLGHDEPEVLDVAGASRAAIAHEASHLVVPVYLVERQPVRTGVS